MDSYFLTLFLICCICHFLRSLYEVLKFKGRLSSGNRMMFGFMLVNMGILWTSWFMMCESDPVKLLLPSGLRVFGLILFVGGLLLCGYALFKLKALDNYTGELIQDGLFAVVRHPMYLGFIFWVIGYALYQQAQYTLSTSIIWIANILFWRHMEEKELARHYPAYREYRKKTIF